MLTDPSVTRKYLKGSSGSIAYDVSGFWNKIMTHFSDIQLLQSFLSETYSMQALLFGTLFPLSEVRHTIQTWH